MCLSLLRPLDIGMKMVPVLGEALLHRTGTVRSSQSFQVQILQFVQEFVGMNLVATNSTGSSFVLASLVGN